MMKTAAIDARMLKQTVKTAIVEVLEERKDMMADLLEEALLDIGLTRAVREGEHTATVSRKEVFAILESKP